jgi:hypothetical protein
VKRNEATTERGDNAPALEPTTDVMQPATSEMDALMQMPLSHSTVQSTGIELPVDTEKDEMDATDEERPTKRKRNAVDYKELFEQMKKEGLA